MHNAAELSRAVIEHVPNSKFVPFPGELKMEVSLAAYYSACGIKIGNEWILRSGSL